MIYGQHFPKHAEDVLDVRLRSKSLKGGWAV